MATETWQPIAAACQKAVLDSIPAKWKLASPPDASVTNVLDIPKTCGLLTPEQLRITDLGATELTAEMSAGRLTAVEVTEAFCGRAAIAHQCVNCLMAFLYEDAMARAKELDAVFQATGKTVGPLHGVPVGIKDHFSIKGQNITCAYVKWHDRVADEDASVVQVLKQAGAIPIGRTIMPQTAMMLQTVSNLWGRTLNPYNRNFSAGGSSGGDGALVNMKGAIFCPSTDIGGSIRAPASYNGLYGIRPSADRIPKLGLNGSVSGQISVKVSSGPLCHSMADLALATKTMLNYQAYIGFEPTCVPFPLKEQVTLPAKLCFGVLRNDGVVTPQPPVRRATEETVHKLQAAGHTVIEFDPPCDLWALAQNEWALYMQTGAKEIKAIAASGGEPLTENFAWYLDTYKVRELTTPELYRENTIQAGFKKTFARAWAATKDKTGTGRPIDGLICPCSPSASFPHEFPVWWGYYAMWNLLDYPSTIVPLKTFKIDAATDPKDADFTPLDNNPFDKMNHEIYDPELWKDLPMCIQVVRQPYEDEDLLAVTEVVDAACNA